MMNYLVMMDDRVATLKRLSELEVKWSVSKGANYYVFGPTDRPLKSVCTYRQAKLFAEGVATGRELGK